MFAKLYISWCFSKRNDYLRIYCYDISDHINYLKFNTITINTITINYSTLLKHLKHGNMDDIKLEIDLLKLKLICIKSLSCLWLVYVYGLFKPARPEADHSTLHNKKFLTQTDSVSTLKITLPMGNARGWPSAQQY